MNELVSRNRLLFGDLTHKYSIAQNYSAMYKLEICESAILF